MKLFLEAHRLKDLAKIATWGPFAGVVTSEPYRGPEDPAISGWLEAQPGDVLVPIEVDAADSTEARARVLGERAGGRVIVGLAPTAVGFEVAHRLRDERVWTATTGISGLGEALLALNAGADVLVLDLAQPVAGELSMMDVAKEIAALSRDRNGRPKIIARGAAAPEQQLACARAGLWALAVEPNVAVAWGAGGGVDVGASRG